LSQLENHANQQRETIRRQESNKEEKGKRGRRKQVSSVPWCWRVAADGVVSLLPAAVWQTIKDNKKGKNKRKKNRTEPKNKTNQEKRKAEEEQGRKERKEKTSKQQEKEEKGKRDRLAKETRKIDMKGKEEQQKRRRRPTC
jgi:hypothetical protein